MPKGVTMASRSAINAFCHAGGLTSVRRACLILAIRLDASNDRPMNYFLLTTLEMSEPRIRFSEARRAGWDKYRLETPKDGVAPLTKAAITTLRPKPVRRSVAQLLGR